MSVSPASAFSRRRLILYAPMIHTGGGKTLLLALLKALGDANGDWDEVRLMVDDRFGDIPALSPNLKMDMTIPPNVLGRLRGEWTLWKLSEEGDVVFCLGNLPPLFPIRGRVVGFIQNAHLLETLVGQTPTTKKRIERWWLKRFQNHCQSFIVQTPSMRDRLLRFLDLDPVRILTLPFVDEDLLSPSPAGPPHASRWDFGYVSLPWAHKNHRRLVEAFILLAREGLTPSLVVTVPEHMDRNLYQWLEEVKETEGVRITNLGSVDYQDIKQVYRSINALIFPSLTESFALPLLEARAFGLPILASERDYVRDVVAPRETFDPESSRSMMRAMKRYLGNPDLPDVVLPASQMLGALSRLGKESLMPNGISHGKGYAPVPSKGYMNKDTTNISSLR